MSEAALTEVVDLAIYQDSKAKAANAKYDEIEQWCENQRRWSVRLWNWLRPWHYVQAPHIPFRPLYWRVLVMIRKLGSGRDGRGVRRNGEPTGGELLVLPVPGRGR